MSDNTELPISRMLGIRAGYKSIALGIVGFLGKNGTNQFRDVFGVHLPVAIDFDDDFVAGSQRGIVAGHGRATHALVLAVLQHCDLLRRERAADKFAGPFRTTIIDDENVIHLGQNPFDDRDNLAPHPEAGYDSRQLHPGSPSIAKSCV